MASHYHAAMAAARSASGSQHFGGGSTQNFASGGAWAAQPRKRRTFEPLPVRTSIPGLKTVEQDLQEQVKHVHTELQQDLDHLHSQVLQEVYNSVAQELQAVASRLAAFRGELGTETDGLRAAIGQLQQEAQRLRGEREQDAKESLEAAQKAAAKVSEELTGTMQAQVGSVREEAKELEKSLLESVMEVCDKVEKEGDENDKQITEMQKQLEKALDDRAGALQKRLDSLTEELRGEAKGETQEMEKLKEAWTEGQAGVQGSLAQLEEGLRGEALICEARFRESQAALAALEERQQAALKEALAGASGVSEQKELRIKYELETLKAGVTADFRERLTSTEAKLQQLGAQCREELSFAHSSLARSIDWAAEIDAAALERDGKLDVESPEFTAAGLRPLRLHLRLVRQGAGPGGQVSPGAAADAAGGGRAPRWLCGVFLRAPAGRVSFKLSVLGRAQGFAAEFGEAPEWGSQKLAVLERVPGKLVIGLEILDVVAPVAGSAVSGLTSSLQVTDAAQAAAKEAAALRSSMVKRVEWRIAKVSERLAAAREAANAIGDDEALEPLCSPPFAAAGFEGLQLQLYPLGYRPRGEETCGFFLVCPRGMYVKCRAFVGDASRNFEHQYDTREPYGRGSFCRLGDKADNDDCVVCGVEFIEVRQEQTTQVRGGPFGNVADQLKIVASPSVGSMEAVRELREIQGGGANNEKKQGRGKNKNSLMEASRTSTSTTLSASQAMRATAPPGGGAMVAQLRESRSLPSLLPAVPSMGGSMVMGGMPMSPPPKQVDSLKWRGSGPYAGRQS